MAEGNGSLAYGGFTIPSRPEGFVFHEVALGCDDLKATKYDWLTNLRNLSRLR